MFYNNVCTKKPRKHGIKSYILEDVYYKFTCNFRPYLGVQKRVCGSVPLAELVVMKPTQPLASKKYNLTSDNIFTSFLLAEKLTNEKISTVEYNRKS